MTGPDMIPVEEHTSVVNNRIRQIAWMVAGLLVVFLIGLGSGYLKWGQDETAEARQQKEFAALYEQSIRQMALPCLFPMEASGLN
jgi:hypothetical protein